MVSTVEFNVRSEAGAALVGVDVSFYVDGVLHLTTPTVLYGSAGKAIDDTVPDGSSVKVKMHDPAGRFPDQWMTRKASQATADAIPVNGGINGVTTTAYATGLDWAQIDIYTTDALPVGGGLEIYHAGGPLAAVLVGDWSGSTDFYSDLYTDSSGTTEVTFLPAGDYTVRFLNAAGQVSDYAMTAVAAGFLGDSGNPLPPFNFVPATPLGTGRVRDEHKIKQLLHVGFNARQALFHEEAPAAPTFRELLLAGMSPRQARTWLRGDHSLDALIRGGFTKAQATVLTES